MVQNVDDWADHGGPGKAEQEREITHLDQMWETVEDATVYAKNHLSWDVDGISSIRGHVPGLALVRSGESYDSTMLSSDQTELAIKALIELKSGFSPAFVIPRVTDEKWDIGDGEALFTQLPGYIETNAAILLRALYDRFIEERAIYTKQRDEVREKLSGEKARLNELRQPGEGSLRIDLLEKRVSDEVSGVQIKCEEWGDRIKPFIDECLATEVHVDERLKEHMVWAPEIVEVLCMPLSQTSSSADYTNRMQNALRLNHIVTTKQGEVEGRLKDAANDEDKTALAYAFNAYEDCKKIIEIYGAILRRDASQSSNKDQNERERKALVDQIKMYSFDAHVLAVEKLIKEIGLYLSTWEDVLGPEEKCESQYNRDMLVCDQKVLEISRKFFEGDVLTEEDASKLRQELRELQIERKLLDDEKRLILEGNEMCGEDRKKFERDVEILRTYRDISGVDIGDGRREMLERDGEILLLERQRDLLKKKLETGSGALSEKGTHVLEYELEAVKIDLKILEIEREMDGLNLDSNLARRNAMETNIKKMGNEKRILEIDKQLNVPGLALISGAERNMLVAEREALVTENDSMDLDVMLLSNDDQVKDILFFAESLVSFCEKLREKGGLYVQHVRMGKDLMDRLVMREKEYAGLYEEYEKLKKSNNDRIEDYRECLEMANSGDQQLLNMQQNGDTASQKYLKTQRRVNLLRQNQETLKSQLASEAIRIGECKNGLIDVKNAIDTVKSNLEYQYKEAITVLGGNSMDVQTYMWILGAVKLILTKVAGLHDEVGTLIKGNTEQLIEDIAEANQSKRLSDVGTPQRNSGAKRTFKPTMMSARDATHYPSSSDGNDRPRVQVVDAPVSHRQVVRQAIGDVMNFGNKDG